MTETIVEYLRDLAATIGGIETSHCLAERRSISTDEPTEIPYIYTGDGGYIPVEVDSGSVSYFRLVNPISFDEVEGRTPVKALKGSYPFTFVAIVRRDDNNPLTYSQDVANLFEGRNKDLASILKASSVHITVSSIETDTPKIWKQEFQVPATTPNYTRSMVMIELTVEVVANRDCWVNCADYPDILQGFPWCAKPAATLARLTDSQLDCLRDELCGVIPDNAASVNTIPYATAPSGDAINVDVEGTDGLDKGSLVGGKWVIADSTATNTNGSFSLSIVAEGTGTLPNITKTDSDGTTSSIPSNEDVTCTPQVKDLFIKFGFLISTEETGTLTIDADNEGTFTSTSDDGSSGTITYNVNGAGFAAFSNPTALAIGNTIAAKRTTDSAAGFAKITGTYV